MLLNSIYGLGEHEQHTLQCDIENQATKVLNKWMKKKLAHIHDFHVIES